MDATLLQLLDQHLAAEDFCSRLCLVSSIVDDGGDDAAEPGIGVGDSANLEDEVSNRRLWPALKFDSQKEFMKHVAKVSIPSNSLGLVKAYLTVAYSRLCQAKRASATATGKESYGVAYLLGGKGQESKIPPIVLISPNEDGEIVKDHPQVFCFFGNFPEMDAAAGTHCGSEEFQAAFQLAWHRSTTRVENNSGEGENTSGDKGLTSSMNITSVRKTSFSNLEYTPLRAEMDNSQKSCPKKQSARGSSKPINKKAVMASTEAEDIGSTNGQLPVKTVEFIQNGSSGSVSSPEKSFSGEDLINHSPIARSRKTRCSPAEEREMPWVLMFDQMKANGWSYTRGAGLDPWWYLHPTCKDMKKNELIRTKVAGVDYFTSEAEMKRYARLNLGWSGSVESVADSPKDAEMADRIKKRKRGLNVQQHKVKPVEVKPTVQKKKNATIIPKVAKKQQVHVPKRMADPNSPDSSRFSGSSISHRTRSHGGSPTVSELEADIGVQSAKRKKSANQKMLKFGTQNDPSNESFVESESESASGRNSTSDTSEESSYSSNGDSDSEQSSKDEMYQIMSGSSAWRLLQERFGFTYHSGKYCLPGKENRPGKDSTAMEGMNYFGSLDKLRKHLCAYGLPEVKKHLTENEVCDLSRWVRYANVIGLTEGALINPKDIGEPLNFMKAWGMLQKLGMKYSSGYIYPSSDPSKVASKFERVPEFMVHVARFGIPHVDGIQSNEVLSEDDRFKLDLFIADTDRDCL